MFFHYLSNMAWILLLAAGLFEIGWPLGFKLADTHPKYFYPFIIMAIISMAVSGYLLYMAQRSIPIGTAYVVWTGIGAVGTVITGILLFNDSASLLRMFFVLLILAGVVGLKIVH